MEITQTLNTFQVLEILEKIGLDDHEKEVAQKSFCTRAKWKDEALEFQFKFLPEWLTDEQKMEIQNVMNMIEYKLKNHFHGESVRVNAKIEECCETDCFCCTIFPTNKLEN